ncbi:MAG: hypothetical protein FK734_01635 [Asgard group archaeon]|nr:hypothetical protein [Asgard group archaeon]
MEKDDYIPLFARIHGPVGIYVVNNQLLELYSSLICYHFTPYKTFHFLQQIYVGSYEVREYLPKTMQEPLTAGYQELEDIIKHSKGRIRVLGEEESGFCNHCFDFNIAITSEGVVFNDFQYEYHDKKETLENCLPLDYKQAYLLLANMLLSMSSVYPLESLFYTRKKLTFDYEYYKQGVLEYYQQIKRDRWNDFAANNELLINTFNLDHLIFIQQKLEAKELTPYDILRFNGETVLLFLSDTPVVRTFIDDILTRLFTNYSNLSLTKKILFYTFFRIISSHTNDFKDPLVEKLKTLKQENKSLLLQIEKELLFDRANLYRKYKLY